MEIIVKFNNLERTIPYIKDYTKFKENIKKQFCLEQEEFNVTFLLYNQNSNLKFKIVNEKDYSNAINILQLFQIKIVKIDIKKNPNYSSKQIKNIDEVINRTINMEISEKIKYEYKKSNKQKPYKIPSKLHIKEKSNLLLNCNFIDNNNKENHTINIQINKIMKYQPIEYHFRINNNGEQEWPNDTFLKCENDDTEIYFYYVSNNDEDVSLVPISNDEVFYKFKVKILFKNYRNIHIGEYKLRASLISDNLGRIGNEYGILIINVIK